MGLQPGHQAALLAAQNREMEAMERRQARERAAMPVRAESQSPRFTSPYQFVFLSFQPHAHAQHDEDSGDEFDHISTRSLALARYKRNHDYMNEVFNYAAFGTKIQPSLC